jgi:hypothetical protein
MLRLNSAHHWMSTESRSAQELRIECMFPAEEATEIHHAEMMGTAENP